MKKSIKNFLIFVYLFICLFGLAQVTQAADSDPFTFVILGDIQNETWGFPSVLASQCQWIVDNASSQNIKAVFSMGDLTDEALNEEFQTARTNCFDKLKTAGIINMPTMGNHDYDTIHTDSSRNNTRYSQYFGTDYFSGDSWYIGNYNNNNANYYIKFNIGDRRFLVLDLEFFPETNVVTWANSIIEANPSYEIIVVTHAYLKRDGTLFQDDDVYGPNHYSLSVDSNSGQDLWDNLISNTTNVRAVLSGHDICLPNFAFTPATTTTSSVVNQLFVDYQCADNGGDGWIGLLTLNTSAETGTMRYYRTYAPSGLGYDATTYSMSWPIVSDTTLPTVDAFTLPSSVQKSLTVPVLSFTASDDIGVTGYMLTESATAPLAGDAGWNVSAPDTYIFSNRNNDGEKTLYAWAKDAAGNISNSLSANVTIDIPRQSRVSGSYANHAMLPVSIILENTDSNNTVNYNNSENKLVSYNFGNAILRNGSAGDAVKELQRFLNKYLNLNLLIDGKFGPKTNSAVKNWQAKNSLVSDGLVGPKTKAKMNSSVISIS
jgi:hypothetical protein